ncbi:hypothetical protein J6V85_04165 [Candidatus Saccharibacteria bacterium]|nr:hypothetical protein [Candidatus Saccharibacteria bacterium]
MPTKMRKSFTMERKDEDGNLVKEKYTYIPYEKLDFSRLKLSGDKFRFGIIKVACAFDIETTSYYSAKYDKDLATMYIWQLGLNKDTIIGRTWEEFVELLNLISDHAARFDGTVICLIQNLSFEFQFIKSILKWNTNKEGYPDIFAKDDRTILYARYKNIEFRDTLALTGMSLKRFKKNYNLDVGKLDGDLDYKLYRHTKTPVTNRELAYCINDVQVLTDFFYKYLFPEYIKPGIKIPLTSTGIVRADIKAEFMAIPKEERKKLLNRINNAQPTEEVYKLWRNFLFRGGLVHASTIACNYLWEDEFGSLDLKSAHPSNMLALKYPWKYNRRNKSDFPKILQQARTGDYDFFGVFIFHKIRASGYHSLESKNKIIEMSSDAVFENGRLVYASMIKVALISLDWFNYEDLYEWTSYEVRVIYQAKLDYLPDYVRKVICKYFIIKETSTGVERNLAKRKVNGVFGMSATSLPEHEVVFNEETNEMELSSQARIYKDLTRYLIMLPQWAIFTAAATRRSIVRSIKECGFDSLYYDTDSNKIMKFDLHKEWFDNFNAERMEINRNMNTYDFEKKYFERLGCFELEYIGKRFKVLGCKRYLVTHDGNTQVTIAGCVKGSFEKYAEKLFREERKIPTDEKLTEDQKKELEDLIYEMFTDDLRLPPGDSEKKTTVYYDKAFVDTLTDYEGNTKEIREGSCVAIIDIPFTMSMEEDFINRIEELSHERERMIYKGVL